MGFFASFISRIAVTAWVGAAVLFVIVSIREVRYAEFDAIVKDQLVALRFPLYYASGFALMGAGTLATLATRDVRLLPSRRRRMASVLLLAALGVLAADYFWVFSRLMTMILPPGQPRPSNFVVLHKLSMWVNFVQLMLCSAAAAVLNWPARSHP